jgi:predicted RNA-binding protein (virulence factor B family)
LENRILRHLNQRGGKSQITDKSAPEIIYREFKVSKKKYKNALGALYKKRQILIAADTISLVE